jgi:predicted Abi (CAAX) family protease
MTFRRLITALLALCIAGLGIQQQAQAAAISTDAALAATSQPSQRERVLRFLDRADVQQQLESRGVSAADAKARVATLNDTELAQVAGQIDSLPAGGDVGILGFILVVFLVLLLTDILGFTHIFPFTKPMK